MPWNTLTTAQISGECSPDEVAALNLIQGSTTILATVMASCVAEIQATISNAGNQIGPIGTIPDQVLRDVIPWIRWEWFCALPSTGLQSKEREKQAQRWEKRRERITGSDGKPREKIEIPAVPQNITGADSRVEVVRPGHLHAHQFSKFGES